MAKVTKWWMLRESRSPEDREKSGSKDGEKEQGKEFGDV